MIRSLRGKTPVLGPGVFAADSAEIVGDVRLGRDCSIWHNVTLRGDVMPIIVGDESNIQDNAVVHGTYQKQGTVVGNRVTVGHSAILHGCEIGDEVLVGMGAIVMDRARIPRHTIVGAGSLVTEGQVFPEGNLVFGRPARVVRPLTPEEIAFLAQSARNYLNYKTWYTEGESR